MFAGMPIVPDDKDWTWVLDKPCPDCGFAAAWFPRDEVSNLIRANTKDWARLSERNADRFTVRPADDRWSAVEYACHVRDVYRLYDYRLHLMLDNDDPEFPNWDQDVTAVEERYGEQLPAEVIPDLGAAGHTLADSFDGVAGDMWVRTGNRSDGKHFTVETFARYLVHDPVHHIWDIRQNFKMLGD